MFWCVLSSYLWHVLWPVFLFDSNLWQNTSKPEIIVSVLQAHGGTCASRGAPLSESFGGFFQHLATVYIGSFLFIGIMYINILKNIFQIDSIKLCIWYVGLYASSLLCIFSFSCLWIPLNLPMSMMRLPRNSGLNPLSNFTLVAENSHFDLSDQRVDKKATGYLVNGWCDLKTSSGYITGKNGQSVTTPPSMVLVQCDENRCRNSQKVA